jgi:TPR repeat protein
LGELVKKALTFLLVCSSLVFVSALAQDLPSAATPQGEVQLGNVYSEQRDYAKAMTWYREAADQGNSDGQNNVGWLYPNGFGVKQNYGEALTWYRKAADQGNAASGMRSWLALPQGIGY